MSRTIPPIRALVDTLDWKAASSPNAREAAAAAWVRRGQRETGCEHVAVLTRGGTLLYAGSSGLSDKVEVPPSDGEDVVLLHSHPGEDSLSAADFGVAWSRSRFSEVRAYTPDGSMFAGRSLVPPVAWRPAREAARAAVASELRVLGRRDSRSYSYLAAHLVNAELERVGLVWYEMYFGRAVRGNLARLASDLEPLRAVIRREVGRDG